MKLGVLEVLSERVDGSLKKISLFFDTLFRVKHEISNLPFQVPVYRTRIKTKKQRQRKISINSRSNYINQVSKKFYVL